MIENGATIEILVKFSDHVHLTTKMSLQTTSVHERRDLRKYVCPNAGSCCAETWGKRIYPWVHEIPRVSAKNNYSTVLRGHFSVFEKSSLQWRNQFFPEKVDFLVKKFYKKNLRILKKTDFLKRFFLTSSLKVRVCKKHVFHVYTTWE